MKNSSYKFLFLFTIVVTACQPKLDAPLPDKGTANFSTYISIGDGVPAGYADGALNLDGQIASFANVLAQQLTLVGGGEFVQPLVPAGIGYGYENNTAAAKLILQNVTFCDGTTQLYPIQLGTRTLFDIIGFKITNPGLKYNNLAAQGARAIYVNSPSTAAAPWGGFGGSATYWSKFASSTSSTILSDALAQSPTFFTIYLGNTDVFRFAKSGGNQQSAAGPSNDDFITPADEFKDSVLNIVKALTANGAKGAIINLIDLQSFPYFRYYKYDDLVLDATQAAALNAYWAGTPYTFTEGRNAYIIEDPLAVNGYRKMLSNEYICLQLPPDSVNVKCGSSPKWGSYKALPKRWVLDANEIAQVNAAVTAYNTAIKDIASEFNLALVDSNSDMKNLLNGSYVNGIPLSTEYVNGGEFSLDGLNLSARGQIVLANQIIGAINTTYKSKIPYADPNTAIGVYFK